PYRHPHQARTAARIPAPPHHARTAALTHHTPYRVEVARGGARSGGERPLSLSVAIGHVPAPPPVAVPEPWRARLGRPRRSVSALFSDRPHGRHTEAV
ncbi:hypothetical protein, partial [Streptomyces lichenis]